jgi:hypothetical protein
MKPASHCVSGLWISGGLRFCWRCSNADGDVIQLPVRCRRSVPENMPYRALRVLFAQTLGNAADDTHSLIFRLHEVPVWSVPLTGTFGEINNQPNWQFASPNNNDGSVTVNPAQHFAFMDGSNVNAWLALNACMHVVADEFSVQGGNQLVDRTYAIGFEVWSSTHPFEPLHNRAYGAT